MRGPRFVTLGVLMHALAAGCTSSDLPSLLGPLGPDGGKAGPQTESASKSSAPYETAATVPGTPIQVYSAVARGALGCWFAPGGPLKVSHVFRAEAEPPTKGGGAEIVIYERDRSFRDQRGAQAYRIAFASDIGGVRVGMTAIKLEGARAQVMAKDVVAWAKGASSCQLRAPAPQAAPAKGKVVKAKAPATSKKR
jgi:hypothetical protein